jgi:hypothetical protein
MAACILHMTRQVLYLTLTAASASSCHMRALQVHFRCAAVHQQCGTGQGCLSSLVPVVLSIRFHERCCNDSARIIFPKLAADHHVAASKVNQQSWNAE